MFDGASIGLARIRQAASRTPTARAARQFIDYSTLRCEARARRWWADQVTPGTILELRAAAARPLRRAARQPSQQSVTRLIVQDEVILRDPGPAAPADAADRMDRAQGPEMHPGRRRSGGRFCRAPSRSTSCSPTARGFARKFDEDCPALDFYGGFYLQPQDDQQLCAAPRRDPLAHGRKLHDRAVQAARCRNFASVSAWISGDRIPHSLTSPRRRHSRARQLPHRPKEAAAPLFLPEFE